MSDSLSIGISSLKDLSNFSDYLSKNLSFTKHLGKNEEQDKAFIQNFQKDIAFYKRKYSYENAKKVNNLNVKSILGAFNVPAKGPTRQIKGITSSTALNNYLSKTDKNNNSVSSLKKIYQFVKRLNDEKRYSKNMSLKTASFLVSKNNILKGFSKESILAIKDKKHSSKKSIRKSISKKEFDLFQYNSILQKKNLKNTIEESLFVIMNIGNIINTFKTNPTAVEGFNKGTLFSKESLKNDIANKALAALGNQNTIDLDFLENNTKAAVYLLDNIKLLEKISESENTLKNFRETSGKKNKIFNDYVVEQSQKILLDSNFSNEFLQSNIEFSSLILGSEHIDRAISLGEYLNANSNFTQEDFDLNQLIFNYQSFTQKQNLPDGVDLNENFFINQKGILNTALSDENFTQNLSNNIDIIKRFFSSETGSLENEENSKALEAYLDGLSERIE
ncbi:MAG: hypothetical protein KAI43_01475 [Candidatus Aureabacteria bacterium]|nr:hypothetical protein [Candidatus Auribacterota bacterium]